jgi:RHS repeat-associated protein
VPAQLKLRKAHDVAWLATNVPVSGTGTLTFDIQAQITNNYVVTQTVNYQKASTGSGSILYAYDANGNRISKTDEHGRTTSYSYDQDNQLTDIDGYAADGTHFVYSYAYDPFGRRISATEDGVTRYFAYNGLDFIAELDSNANVKKWYLRGSGLGGGIGDIIAEVRPTTTNYFCYNHRGDVVALVSKSGVLTARYEYTAFGAPVTRNLSPVTRSLAFSSKEYDAKSGLSYYGYRYYDAESGRWMTKEPTGKDGPNLYTFLSNPLSLLDYRGLYAYYNSGGLFGDQDYSVGINAPIGTNPNPNGPQPSALDNFLPPIGPAANAYMAQERYFETRWRGWTINMKVYWRNQINHWVASHCGCTPYKEGVSKSMRSDILVAGHNATKYGDKAFTDWEMDFKLGKFSYLVKTPVTINYSSRNIGEQQFSWRTTLYIEDKPGDYSYMGSVTPERKVTSARWNINGRGTCY